MTPAFDRILVVMLENQGEPAVRQDPYMRALAERGVRLSAYYGVTHPSQPNYFAATAGLPLTAGDGTVDVDAKSIVDLLEARGVSWKAYMEDLPDDDKAVTVSQNRLYARKHNPFVSFDRVREDPARLAKVVNAREFAADVAAGAVPRYAWYTPNLQNDGHTPPGVGAHQFDGGVTYLSGWLQGFLTPLLADRGFMKGQLIAVLFDESIPYADNHVYATLLGDMAAPGTVEAERYDHYSLLRTVEENFELGHLGTNDLTASWFRFLFGQPDKPFSPADHRQ